MSATDTEGPNDTAPWLRTACVLCSNNCGVDSGMAGVAPNELTTTDWCDPIARTPGTSTSRPASRWF